MRETMIQTSTLVGLFCLTFIETVVSFPGTNAEVCGTSGCLEAANTILSYMDPTVDPCQDFYRFTCGNLLKLGEKSAVTSLFLLVRDQLVEFLTNRSIPDLPAAFVKVQDYYQSCMDIDAAEKIGLVPMKEALNRYGGWPVTSPQWSENNSDWIKTMKRLVIDGHASDMIAYLYVDNLPSDNTKRVMKLNKPSLGLEANYLLAGISDPVSQAYYQFMVDMAVTFGACRAVAEVEMGEVFEFEARIAKISAPDDPLNPYAENPKILSISELQKVCPYIKWSDFVNAVVGRSVKVTDQEPVYVRRPTYFDRLGPILSKTPKKVIANYILWRVLFESRNYLNNHVHQLKYEFYDVYYGGHNAVRWQTCIDRINTGYWRVILGAGFVKRYVTPGIKEKATEIIRLLREQLINVVSTAEWMDVRTRTEAVKKVKNIFLAIGYPDELTDFDLINEYYQDLEINKVDLYTNTFNTRKWKTDKENSRLREPYNKTGWEKWFVSEVNAGYAVTNKISILAAYLQLLYFSVDRPLYLNIGTLGQAGGHELTHSVDSDGAQYDSDGNLRNWWSDGSKENFQMKLKALSAEYSSYFVKEADLYLNGDQVVLEAIADHGGSKVSYMALEKWLSQNPDQESSRIAGMEQFTPRQIFWISFASVQCRKYSRASLNRVIRTDDHAPAEFRVNVVYRNSPFFSADWICPVGSYMNKEEKVNIW